MARSGVRSQPRGVRPAREAGAADVRTGARVRTGAGDPGRRAVRESDRGRGAPAGRHRARHDVLAWSRGRSRRAPLPAAADRSTWERLAITPDVEIHVRRPLDRFGQQARRAAGPDRPGAVRRGAVGRRPARPPAANRHRRPRHPAPPSIGTRPIRASTRIPRRRPDHDHAPDRQRPQPADRLVDARLSVRPDRRLIRAQRPQRALPARRRHRPHGRRGPGPPPAARQPRLRPRPVRVHGRAQQAVARQAGGRSRRSTASTPGTASPS